MPRYTRSEALASVSPGSIGLSPVTNVLIAAVLGGIGHPLGAYLGAFVFTVVNNFAVETIVRDRFNTLIGLVFLLVVLFSPDGLAGAWSLLHAALAASSRLG